MKSWEIALIMSMTVILLIGLTAQPTENNTIASIVPNHSDMVKESIPSYIWINDGDFLSEGFTGSGTEAVPYILDGVTITDAFSGYGVYITGTTAHFIIQNCVLNFTSVSCTRGIFFDYMSNGTILNCTIIGSSDGIYVDHSEDINVIGTRVYDCTSQGFNILGSSSINLIGNTVSDCGSRGIQVQNTPNLNITGNTVKRINYDNALSTSWGIDCQLTDNLTISNNEVRSAMKGTGIYIGSVDNVVVDSNVIWQASNCVSLYNTPGIVISNNNISCGYNYNLWIQTVTDANVTGNRIFHTTNANGRGIYSQGSSNCTYEANDIWRSFYGIQLDTNSANNTIYDNNIGWCDLYTGYDFRTASPQNNWTSNQFDNYVSGNYTISGTAGVNDTSASLLTDSTSPTIDSPDDITINDTDTDKWVTWHPDDGFQDVYMRYINYSDPQMFTWCNSSISISLDGLAPGVYDISITAYDCTGYSSTQDNVRVTVLDTQAPVFTSATADYTLEYGGIAWFNITATDDTPYLRHAYIDGAGPYLNDGWTSPHTLNFNPGMPGVGEHNYTIVLTDKAGNSAKATCIVTVEDTTAPTSPDFPSDFSAEAGDHAWVNFTLNDPYHDTYEIWLDDVMDATTTFDNGEYIKYMLNYDTPGEHNVTVLAWDESSNELKLTCIVTYVDNTGPSITGLDDFAFEAGDSLNAKWNWTELNPDNYTIYENGTQVAFSSSFSSQILYSLNHLTPGKWNLTLVLYDDSGNRAVDELWVTAEDTTAPTLTGFNDLSIELGHIVEVIWNVNDIDEWDQDGTWTVYQNGTEMITGVWNTTQIKFQIAPEIRKEYNLTVVVVDAYGNSDTFTTWITTHDDYPPQLSNPDDQEIFEGQNATLSWTCSELDPAYFILYRNGTNIHQAVWDGSDVTHTTQGLDAGVYNFTLVLFDGSGNSGSDTVFVTVVADTSTTTTTTTDTSTSTSTSTSTTDTTTTDTTTPTQPGEDGTMMVMIIASIGGALLVILIVLYLRSRKA